MSGIHTHTRGKRFSVQVRDPITELIVTSPDEAALLKIQNMGYGEGGAATLTAGRDIRGLNEPNYWYGPETWIIQYRSISTCFIVLDQKHGFKSYFTSPIIKFCDKTSDKFSYFKNILITLSSQKLF